jgi:phage-related protein
VYTTRVDEERLKPIEWIGSSLDDLRAFPEEARYEAGYQLDKVQRGEEPSDWKPMRGVGPGVNEIRVRTGREHRVFYVARFKEAVFVLHAFEKKSQKTSQTDIEMGQRRYRLAVERHERRKESR